VLFFTAKADTSVLTENLNPATLWCYFFRQKQILQYRLKTSIAPPPCVFLRQRQILQYWLKISIAPPSCVIFSGKGRYCNADWKLQSRHPLVFFFLQRQILQYWLKTSIAPPSGVFFFKGRYFNTDWKLQSRHPLALFRTAIWHVFNDSRANV